MRAWAVLVGIWLAVALPAQAQVTLRFWTFTPEGGDQQAIGARLYGEPHCITTTLLVDAVAQTEKMPPSIDNETQPYFAEMVTPDRNGRVSKWTYERLIQAARKSIYERCRQTPKILRVALTYSDEELVKLPKWPEFEFYSYPLVAQADSAASASAMFAFPDGARLDLSSRPTYDSDINKALGQTLGALSRGGFANTRAEIDAYDKAKRDATKVGSQTAPFVALTCDPAGLHGSDMASMVAAFALLLDCEVGKRVRLQGVDRMGNEANRIAAQKAFEPVRAAYSGMKRWFIALPPENEKLLFDYIAHSHLDDYKVRQEFVDFVALKDVPTLQDRVWDAWKVRAAELKILAADKRNAQKLADAEAEAQAMAEADTRKARRLNGITSVSGGPTGEDVASAIVAAYIGRGYTAYRQFGVELLVKSIFGQTGAADAFEIDIKNLTCSTTKVQGVYSCSYDFTHVNKVGVRDKSGNFADQQRVMHMAIGLANPDLYKEGVDPFTYTMRTTDLFTTANGKWTSPSWVSWLERVASREMSAGAPERKKCDKDYQMFGDKLVGFWATPSVGCDTW